MKVMVVGGDGLEFSRLIDNSVVVLENIFRHLELGESPTVAAEAGGKEVQLPVLAATFTTAIVFFPVALLYGVSRYLFTALALAVGFSLFASYVVAMTVVPLYCARFIKSSQAHASEEEEINAEGQIEFRREAKLSFFTKIVRDFNRRFQRMLELYVVAVNRTILRPVASTIGILGAVVLTFALFPLLGRAYFPRTDPGQFVININCPSGTRLELSNKYVAQVEGEIRQVIPDRDLGMFVSNIGITPDLSAIYSSNSSPDTAFV